MPLTLKDCTPGLAVICPTGRGMDDKDIANLFRVEGTDLVGIVLTADDEAALVYWGLSLGNLSGDRGVPQVLWHQAEYLERDIHQPADPQRTVQAIYAQFGVRDAAALHDLAEQRAIVRQELIRADRAHWN